MNATETWREAFNAWWRSRPVCVAVKSPRGFAQMVWRAASKGAASPLVHGAACQADSSARDVCEAMYAEKCDDVIGLVEALRAVLALAGESAEIRKIVDDAIAEHGGVEA